MTNIKEIEIYLKPIKIIFCLMNFFYIFRGIIRGIIKGAGNQYYLMLINVSIYCLLLPSLMYIFVFIYDYGFLGIWIARSLSEFFIGFFYNINIIYTDYKYAIDKS